MTSTDDASIVDQAVLETIATELRDVGWAVIDRAIPAPIIAALRDDLLRLDDGAFKSPGVGRGDDWQRSDDVRRDRVHWLDPDSEASQWYFRWVDSLRVGLNRRLMLGLFDYECHHAWYSPGAFYATHVDAFHGDDNRKVSTVLYLNENWQPGDGGELALYAPIATDAAFEEYEPGSAVRIVDPIGGTFVCFLSQEIPHQVLDAHADRFSIAGWYRVNSTGRRPDPPIFALDT